MSEKKSKIEHHQHKGDCEHCHGKGHHVCKSCDGKGSEICSKCSGEKKLVCGECSGKGKFSTCSKCNNTGKTKCGRCGGGGTIREDCSRCGGKGRISRTIFLNCKYCHGRGERLTEAGNPYSCSHCGGRGQVPEEITETCPTCGGSGEGREVTCPRCHGDGKMMCPSCNGTGQRICSECDGSGEVKCDKCAGKGEVTCHECHGGGGPVCADCYGTGDKLGKSPKAKSGGMDKVNAGIAEYKAKHYIAAFKFYREAAVEYSVPAAYRRLGKMYEQGVAITRSEKRANELYRIAANSGDLKALLNLGVNYAKGVGVAANKAEARRLLEIASVKGCTEAEVELKNVAGIHLVCNAISGVVGWQKSIDAPAFLKEADPEAEKKEKDRKAAEDERNRESRQNLYWYVILGLIGSPIGLHFAYARRWMLMIWHLALFAGGLAVALIPSASALAVKWMAPIRDLVKSRVAGDSAICGQFAGYADAVLSNPFWILLGISCVWSVLFMHKDGTGHNMRWSVPWRTSRAVYIAIGILAPIAGYRLLSTSAGLGLIFMIGWHLLYAGKWAWWLVLMAPVAVDYCLYMVGIGGGHIQTITFGTSMLIYLVSLFCKEDGEGRDL